LGLSVVCSNHSWSGFLDLRGRTAPSRSKALQQKGPIRNHPVAYFKSLAPKSNRNDPICFSPHLSPITHARLTLKNTDFALAAQHTPTTSPLATSMIRHASRGHQVFVKCGMANTSLVNAWLTFEPIDVSHQDRIGFSQSLRETGNEYDCITAMEHHGVNACVESRNVYCVAWALLTGTEFALVSAAPASAAGSDWSRSSGPARSTGMLGHRRSPLTTGQRLLR